MLNKIKKIKIGLFVESRFLPSYDGASNRFHYLSNYLQSTEKVDVIVFHCHRGWSDVSLIKKQLFKTYLISSDNYYKNPELLATIIQKEKIDILQFHGMESILALGVLLSKITGTRLIYEIHYNVEQLARAMGESNDYLTKVKNYKKQIGRNVDYSICLSIDDKNEIKKQLNIKEREISVIPSGVDCEEIKYKYPVFNKKNIAYLGNLFFKPNEDAVRILKDRIYPKLSKEGFKFLIAGDCPINLKNELTEDDFIFVGSVSDLNKFFKQATICVAPILQGTGIRIKFLNFLAAGIPILTTTIATNGFLNKNSFIIEDNFDKYANKIIELFNDHDKILRISIDGRKFVEKEFDWKIIARKVVKIYKRSLLCSMKNKECEILISEKPIWIRRAIKENIYKVMPAKLHKEFSFAEINGKKIQEFKIQEIITLEGMPGTGKTSFIKNVKHSKEIKCIDELIVPKRFLSKSDLNNSKLYFNAEKNKFKRVIKLSKKYKKIILDRCFLSILAFTYAKSKVDNSQDYEKLLNHYYKIKHQVVFPTRILFLDCSILESVTRRRIFSNNIEYRDWFDINFLKYFREFYIKEIYKIVKVPIEYIDTEKLLESDINELLKKKLFS